MKLYILKVYLTSMALFIPVGLLLYLFFPDAKPPNIEFSLNDFITVVFVAPIIETLLMIPIIGLIKIFVSNITYVALISAFVWGVIHSLSIPLHGIAIFSLFFLMTMAYLHWDVRSRGHALLVVMSIHALQNSTVFIVSAL